MNQPIFAARACERSVSFEKAAPRSNLFLQLPLTAPFPLRDLLLRAPIRSASSFFCNSRSPLRSTRFSARFAPFFAPLTLRSRSAHTLCSRLGFLEAISYYIFLRVGVRPLSNLGRSFQRTFHVSLCCFVSKPQRVKADCGRNLCQIYNFLTM